MTIEKGEPWGSPFDGEPRLKAADDADLARLADEGRSDGEPPLIAVGPGDVAATIGANVPLLDTGGRARHHRFPMDLGYVSLGNQPGRVERTIPFVAHVLGHRWPSWLRGWLPWPELIVMNTPLASGLRVGPRAHPNDGRLDITVGSLPWQQGREANRRAATGTHVPHPLLDVGRKAEAEFSPNRRLHVVVDGVDRGRWSWLSVRVVPDAFFLVARVA
ncbi:MAG: hypothetical protein OEZ14_08260 [Acidimicrobiia bacterium]|nr:hypothetical protein [Acidimicrobiia bacterium]